MSYRILPLIWRAPLDSTAKLVLLRMADHANDDGGNIFPSVPAVATACGLRDRAVQNAIRRLREIGVLIEVRAADFSSRRPTEYMIGIDRLQIISEEPDRCIKDAGVLNAPVHQMREPVSLKTITGVLNAPKSLREPSIKSSREEGGVPQAKFAWQGNVIRLTKPDYDKWRKAYADIGEFDAELQAADDYYSQNTPKDGKWFFPVSNWLKRANATPSATRRAAYSIDDAFEQARQLRETY